MMANRSRRKPHAALQLPPCPGPKLHAFQHQNETIEWLERLDEDREGQSGAQGCVFKVRIKSRAYALKVFKFFNPLDTRYYWGPLLGNSVPLETVIFHTDPFYAECRAYGRIKEACEKQQLKRQVAVPCHGYLFLSEGDRQFLQDSGVDLGHEAIDDQFLQAAGNNRRIRAIVKDLVPGDSGVNNRNVHKILRDIRYLNKLGIYVRDIRADNFKGGKLLDFGSSRTDSTKAPHCILAAMDQVTLRASKSEDLVMFDEMVAEEDLITGVRAMPNPDYRSKLRSWSK